MRSDTQRSRQREKAKGLGATSSISGPRRRTGKQNRPAALLEGVGQTAQRADGKNNWRGTSDGAG